MFDLGIVKLNGKQDGKGALAAWQRLLKSNPQLSAERKATVQKLMAAVMTTLSDQNGIEGSREPWRAQVELSIRAMDQRKGQFPSSCVPVCGESPGGGCSADRGMLQWRDPQRLRMSWR